MIGTGLHSTPASASFEMDPAFHLVRGSRLMPWEDIDPQLAWRHLSAQVARDPLDVEAHTRRVLLAQGLPTPDRLLAALMDLFLALGSRGFDLREKLLDLAAPGLDPDDAHFLLEHLSSGLPPGTPLPAGCQAVLDVSVLGRRDVVRVDRIVTAVDAGPLALASEMLDLGDVAGAQALLESSVLEAPDDPALARELLTIYRHSRDDAGRAALVERLKARWGRVPAPWQ